MPTERPKITISNEKRDEVLSPRLDEMAAAGKQYKGGWDRLKDRGWRWYLQKPEQSVKTWPWPGAPLSDDTEVLTKRGWINIQKVIVGRDRVFSFDPDTEKTGWQPITDKPSRYYDYLIHFKSKSVDQMISPDHKMFLLQTDFRTGKKKYVTRTAQEVQNLSSGAHLQIPLSTKGGWEGKHPKTLYGFKSEDLCEFIGWYIAEGYPQKGSTYKHRVANFSLAQKKPEGRERIQRLLTRMGLKFGTYPTRFVIQKGQLPEALQFTLLSLGKCDEKHIPSEFLGLSPTLLKHLFRGLIHGDGHVRSAREHQNLSSLSYYTTSKKLADQVQEIVQKMGMRATITERMARVGGIVGGRTITGSRTGYSLQINFKPLAKVKSLVSKLVPYGREAHCLTTPWHTIYIRRNGIASWTHNCNYVSSMVTVAVDSLNSLYFDAMLTTRPQLITSNDTKDEETRLLDEFFFDFVWKKQLSLELFGDSWNFNTSMDGTSVAGYRWDRDLTVVRSDVIESSTKKETTTRVVDGVSIDTSQITGFDTKTVEEARAERGDKPVIDVLDMSRLFVAPGTKRALDVDGSLQYPNCPWYFIEVYKTEEQMRQMRGQGFDFLEEEDIQMALVEPERTEREQTQDQHDGTGNLQGERGLFQIFFMRLVLPSEIIMPDGETKTQDFMDEDGIAEEVILWYLPKSKKVSMIMPLSRMYPDNRRPHIDNHHVTVGNFFFSMGVPGLLEQTAKLDTSATRQLVDYGSLVNKPWAFYEPARTGLVPSIQSIQPGALVPVENASGVKTMQFARSHDFWQLIRTISAEWQERLTNVTDFVGGRNASLPNSPRTFRGQATMLQQANIAFAHRVALRSIGFVMMMHRIKNLYHRNAPPNMEFSYFNQNTGLIANRNIERDMLKNAMEFIFKLNPNRALESQQAQSRLALVGNMPWLAQDPEAMHNAMEDVYKAEGKLDIFHSKVWPQQKLEVHIQETEALKQAQQAQLQAAQGMPGGAPGPGGPQPGPRGLPSAFANQGLLGGEQPQQEAPQAEEAEELDDMAVSS